MSTVSRPPRAGKFPGFRNLSDGDLIDIISGDHPWVQPYEVDEATEEASAELVRRLERRKRSTPTPVEARLEQSLMPIMRDWLGVKEEGDDSLGPCGSQAPLLMARAAIGVWLAASDATAALAEQGMLVELPSTT